METIEDNPRRDLSGLEFFQKIQSGEIPQPPIHRLMNLQIVEIGEGRAVYELEPHEDLYNGIGIVHGGVAATLLDSTLGSAVNSMMAAGKIFTTLEMKTNYVRPITSKTGKVFCMANVIHVGNRTATAEGKIVDENGKLFAHGTATFMLFQGKLKTDV